MKIKVVLLTLMLSLLLAFSCSAAILHDVVEISFKVGDSTLLVNGNEMTVETPYVVGEGVTLVPVRVITEAFGAKVGWEQSEKRVTLQTDEKEIELWIGKDIACVNDINRNMLSSPELSNNVTMVPLRFISENFGAEVSYDKETKSILVMLDKGSVLENGMQVFDDGNVRMLLPVGYELQDGNAFSYTFINPPKRNNSEYDVVWNYSFCISKLDDIEQILENDKTKQKESLKNKDYLLSSIEKMTIGKIDVYSYTAFERNKSIFRIKKTIYNFGEYTYFTISAYDDYYNFGKMIKENETLTEIRYSHYSVSVPKEFSECQNITTIPFDASGKGLPKIDVSVFSKPDDFKLETFIKTEANAYQYVLDRRNIEASDVNEYTLNGKTYYGYELSYNNGGKEYVILADYDSYYVFFKFGQQEFEYAESVIVNFKLDEREEVVSELESPYKRAVTTIETDKYVFDFPKSFELYSSDDEKYHFAVDSQNSMSIEFYYDLDTVANEKYTYVIDEFSKKPEYRNNNSDAYSSTYSSPLEYSRETLKAHGFIPMINNNLSKVAWDAVDSYKNVGWDLEYQKRISETYPWQDDYNGVPRDEMIPTDKVICYKSYVNGVDVYQQIVFVFTDTEEYTLSDEDEVLKVVKLLMGEEVEKKIDMPDQKVHAFVVTYTDSCIKEDVDALLEKVMDSVEFK